MGGKIKNIFGRVKNNNGFVKVFSFTAISTFVKILTSFITVKVVAVLIGPSGMALLGQLGNFSSIVMTLSSGGINNGVTKYIAENKDSETSIKNYLSTALKLTIICSFVCGLVMVVFNALLSNLIFKSDEFGYVFILFGLTLFLYSLNNLLISILNGFKEFKKYISVNIVGSIVGLIFTIVLVYISGLKGALISAVTYQSFVFFISLWIVRKLSWFNKSYFKERLNKIIAHKYFKYTLMTFVTAATIPVSQLILRSYVISNISFDAAGWWEAINKISNLFLMVITSSLSVYYLPRLSEIRDDSELKTEIFKAYKIIIPIVLFGVIFLYASRFFVIKVLFTQDFLSMENLFLWQLIGDFFKITSWLLAFVMIARTMTKTYIITEIAFSLSLVLLGIFFANQNGIIGITQAYALNYFLYFLLMIIIFRKLFFLRKNES